MKKLINLLLISVLLLSPLGPLSVGPLYGEGVSGKYVSGQDLSAKRTVTLSLADVSQLALENNLDIQIAKYDAYIKRNDLLSSESIFDTILTGKISYNNDQKKSSSALAGTKTLTGDYEIGLEKKTPTGTTLGLDFENERTWSNSPYASINPAHDASVKFSITQEIGKNFFGLIDRGNIQITKLEIENSDFTCLDKIETSLSDVQKAYWKLILLRGELNIREDMLVRAQRLYDIYKDKHRMRLVEDPDLFGAEANVIRRKAEILQVKDQLNLAKNDLLFKLNEEDTQIDIEPEDLLGLIADNINLVDSLREAINYRRDYQRANADVESKNIKLKMKKNNLWPEIDIEASFLRNGIDSSSASAWEGISNEDNPETYIGLSFKLPLENRDAQSQYNKAKLEKAKYIVKLKQIERRILSEINDKVTTARFTIEEVEANRRITELEEKKLKSEEKRFKQGRSDSDTLIRFQEDLLVARLSLVKSLYNHRLAIIELKLAKNSLLDEYWKDEL